VIHLLLGTFAAETFEENFVFLNDVAFWDEVVEIAGAARDVEHLFAVLTSKMMVVRAIRGLVTRWAVGHFYRAESAIIDASF